MSRCGVRVLLLLLAAGACGGDTRPSMVAEQQATDVVDDADEAAVSILRRCVSESHRVCAPTPALDVTDHSGFVSMGQCAARRRQGSSVREAVGSRLETCARWMKPPQPLERKPSVFRRALTTALGMQP